MSQKQFALGNEAIARSAWEAGVHVATGYPGTPGTEIIENLARYEDIDVEWSTNEMVFLTFLPTGIDSYVPFGSLRTMFFAILLQGERDNVISSSMRFGVVLMDDDAPGLTLATE